MSGAIAEFETNGLNGNLKNVQLRKLSKTQTPNTNGDAAVHTLQNKTENNTSMIADGVNITNECESKLSTTVNADALEKNQPRQTEVVKQASNVKAVGETKNGNLADRLKSLQKMSTMEQESLLEKEHLLQIKSCSAIIHSDVKYTRDSFRRLFISEVSNYIFITS